MCRVCSIGGCVSRHLSCGRAIKTKQTAATRLPASPFNWPKDCDGIIRQMAKNKSQECGCFAQLLWFAVSLNFSVGPDWVGSLLLSNFCAFPNCLDQQRRGHYRFDLVNHALRLFLRWAGIKRRKLVARLDCAQLAFVAAKFMQMLNFSVFWRNEPRTDSKTSCDRNEMSRSECNLSPSGAFSLN